METNLILPQPSGGPEVEVLRYLYTRLRHRKGEQGAQTMLFTGANEDEQIASILVNLAQVAANVGEKALLVDSNMRQPALHRLLDYPCVPGLADILIDAQEWHKVVQITQLDNLNNSRRSIQLESC